MSLIIRRANEKAKKHRKRVSTYYKECFEDLDAQLRNNVSSDSYDYKFNVMHNTITLWGDFVRGDGPILPTQTTAHTECPIMKMVYDIFTQNIERLLGKGENLETLNAMLDEVNSHTPHQE